MWTGNLLRKQIVFCLLLTDVLVCVHSLAAPAPNFCEGAGATRLVRTFVVSHGFSWLGMFLKLNYSLVAEKEIMVFCGVERSQFGRTSCRTWHIYQ